MNAELSSSPIVAAREAMGPLLPPLLLAVLALLLDAAGSAAMMEVSIEADGSFAVEINSQRWLKSARGARLRGRCVARASPRQHEPLHRHGQRAGQLQQHKRDVGDRGRCGPGADAHVDPAVW